MTDLESLPAILIPCEDLQSLKDLTRLLYDNGILEDESFKLVNCPENMIEELNREFGYGNKERDS